MLAAKILGARKGSNIRIFAGSFKSQLFDYFRGHIVFWEKHLQFYAN